MEEYIQLPLTAAALRKWLRFADRGGIGQAVGLLDKLAESGTDELMFMQGETITVLMQLDDGKFLGACEGVVGIFHETDVRFLTKLKKPVFTKKPEKPDLQVSTYLSKHSPSIPQTPFIATSPATPHALSPAQTPLGQLAGRRLLSTPSSTSALLSLQDTPSGPQGHQDRTAISINEKMAPADSPSRLDKVQYNVDEGLHIPAVITNSQPLCGPPAEDLRSASVLDDNDDILSSYVYNTSTDAESQPSLPQQHQKEFGNNPPSSLTVSSSASGQGWTVHNQPSSLLAPLNVPKLANDPSDTGYTQAKGRLSQRVQVPSTVMILPNLPAGVSLKQLRERSSPRFPLSPRSVSDSGTYTRHHQAPPSMARQRSDIQQPPPFAQYVDTFNTGWAEQAQPPLASPVPSSFVSTDSPRFGSSPTSRHRTELEPLATSSSETSMRQMTLPSPRLVSNVRDSPGWSNIYPRDGGSDNRSLSSVASSSRVISHSRSLSSLTRTGSLMFQRRPSLPTRTESVSESPREEGLVELNNAQFEFIQPQAADSDAGSSHSTVDSLQMGHSSKLVTRPSPNAKERVRSIYITDGQLDQLEVRPVVDKYGFIHNPKRGSCGPDLDVPDAKDAAALEAYRARELKWVTIMSTMPARSARSSGKVKKLINYGIPNSVRGKAWTYLAEASSRKKETLYHDLCAKAELPECEHILADIEICFHDHSHYADEDALGRQDLHSVIHALLHYLPNVSYEQGLCYLAGMLLLHVEAESAFWLLVACVMDYLPSYFVKSRHGSLLDANILVYVLERGEPELIAYLRKQGVAPNLIFRSWLSSAFVRTLPWASQLRVMDLFFFGDRPSHLGIRVGLAVADLLRDTLLDKRQAAAKVLLAPPPDLLRLSAFLPTLLTIKIPNRTLKKATKWAHEQMPPM